MITRKDLNYTARQQQAYDTLLESIATINDTLRRDRVGVTLHKRNESLTLRYSDLDGKRKEISPKQISFTRNGVENARQCATQIWSALIGGYYDEDWLRASIHCKGKVKPKALLWEDVLKRWGDLDLSFKPETAYWVKLDESLTDGLKTGDRWVAPMHPHWVELFDLANPKPRSFDFTDVEKKSRTIARYFVTNKIPCKPYDLRHCYGIRLRREGIPVSERADSMGHDPATHLKQYQRHIDIHSRIESFKAGRYPI
jgi:integrase